MDSKRVWSDGHSFTAGAVKRAEVSATEVVYGWKYFRNADTVWMQILFFAATDICVQQVVTVYTYSTIDRAGNVTIYAAVNS